MENIKDAAAELASSNGYSLKETTENQSVLMRLLST